MPMGKGGRAPHILSVGSDEGEQPGSRPGRFKPRKQTAELHDWETG